MSSVVLDGGLCQLDVFIKTKSYHQVINLPAKLCIITAGCHLPSAPRDTGLSLTTLGRQLQYSTEDRLFRGQKIKPGHPESGA